MKNLEVLEDHFQVEISLRGDEMSIVGSQQQIEKLKVIYSLLKLIVSGFLFQEEMLFMLKNL